MREEKSIRGEVLVPAPLDEVWAAWTTEKGASSFFAPACKIEPKVGGAYEIYFDLEEEPGRRGSEGAKILAIEEGRMLSFTWNQTPDFAIRDQKTHVVVRFHRLSEKLTRVTFSQDGWGEGGEWPRAYDYFEEAWLDVVLPRLLYSFTVGPVDWKHRPKLNRSYKGGKP
jgi:uncharacterized protein YndB with AHSA1/START domain